jgi:hypothetical protein
MVAFGSTHDNQCNHGTAVEDPRGEAEEVDQAPDVASSDHDGGDDTLMHRGWSKIKAKMI